MNKKEDYGACHWPPAVRFSGLWYACWLSWTLSDWDDLLKRKEFNIKFKEYFSWSSDLTQSGDVCEQNKQLNQWSGILWIWSGVISHRRHGLGFRQHWKEFCIYALKLQACCLFLRFMKLLAAPFPTWMCRVPFMLRWCFHMWGGNRWNLEGSVWMRRVMKHCWSVL